MRLPSRLVSVKMLAGKMKKSQHNRNTRQAELLRDFAASATRKKKGAKRLVVVQGKKLKASRRVGCTVMRYPDLKLVSRTPDSTRELCSYGQIIDVCFSPKFTYSAMAAIHQVSRWTVKRHVAIGAACYMHSQGQMLDAVAAALEHVPPTFALVHEMWDETGERLRLHVPELGSISSTFEVFVSRLSLVFGWEGVSQPVVVELVVPPNFVRTPSAREIYNALNGGPCTLGIQAALRKILQLARVRMVLDECDAASGNDKLYHFALTIDGAGVLREVKWCGLHQTHLIVTSLTGAVGTDIVSSMYSMSLALRTHGYFLRLHRAAADIIASSRFVIRRCGNASHDGQAFLAELLHYLLAHHGLSHESADNVIGMGRCPDPDSVGSWLTPEKLLNMGPKSSLTGPGSRFLQSCLTLKSLLTGNPWDPQDLTHHCSPTTCGRSNCRSKVTAAVRAVLLREMPVVPVASRWTKVGSCLDFLMAGILMWRLLPLMFDAGFNSKEWKSKPKPRDGDADAMDIDIEQEREEQLHEVTSKRIARARGFLNSPTKQIKVVVLAIVLEPLRCLAASLACCLIVTFPSSSSYNK